MVFGIFLLQYCRDARSVPGLGKKTINELIQAAVVPKPLLQPSCLKLGHRGCTNAGRNAVLGDNGAVNEPFRPERNGRRHLNAAAIVNKRLDVRQYEDCA